MTRRDPQRAAEDHPRLFMASIVGLVVFLILALVFTSWTLLGVAVLAFLIPAFVAGTIDASRSLR